MKYGSITTGIIADGLVFNMDAANRASTIPSSTTTKAFNTVTNKSGSFSTSGIYDGTTLSPSFGIDADSSILTEEEFGWGATEDFSINFFNNAASGTGIGANYNILMNNTNAATDYGTWQFYQYQKKFTIWVNGAGNIGSPNHLSSVQNFNTWYYTSLTRKSGTWSIYYNGIFDYEFGSDSNTAAPTGTVYLGRDKTNTIGYNGNMACISFYNRSLSSTEVLHNYNALKGRFNL